jgi:hypothetical protein
VTEFVLGVAHQVAINRQPRPLTVADFFLQLEQMGMQPPMESTIYFFSIS